MIADEAIAPSPRGSFIHGDGSHGSDSDVRRLPVRHAAGRKSEAGLLSSFDRMRGGEIFRVQGKRKRRGEDMQRPQKMAVRVIGGGPEEIRKDY